MTATIERYFEKLSALFPAVSVCDRAGAEQALNDGIDRLCGMIGTVKSDNAVLRFVGNGGSAAIASHMAVDFSKRVGVAALALNDGAMLTCLGNDLGYENVFAHQIGLHARPGDLLIAVSSSGKSQNILRAAEAARERGGAVVTLSGFAPDNPLRAMGDLNFHLPSGEYGFVELVHLALIGAVADLMLGWTPEDGVPGEGYGGRP